MNANDDQIKNAIARPVRRTSALSEAGHMDWSQQQLHDELSVHMCAQEVIAEATGVLTEADRVFADGEET